MQSQPGSGGPGQHLPRVLDVPPPLELRNLMGPQHQTSDPSLQAIHALIQATLVHALQQGSGVQAQAGAAPSTSAPPSSSAQAFNRGQAARDASPSMSGSQSPSGADRADMENGDGDGGGGGGGSGGRGGATSTAAMSAKEKNRQAQRRFRERQKTLIATLRKKVDDLSAKVAANEKEIAALREDNSALRARVEARTHAAHPQGAAAVSGTALPITAQDLQQLLQAAAAARAQEVAEHKAS